MKTARLTLENELGIKSYDQKVLIVTSDDAFEFLELLKSQARIYAATDARLDALQKYIFLLEQKISVLEQTIMELGKD